MYYQMMNTEQDLFDCCKQGMFPSVKTMSKYGLNGEGFASPIDILNCYRTIFLKDDNSIEKLLNSEDVNTFFENSIYLKNNVYYNRVVENGGVYISSEYPVECEKCFYNGSNQHSC